MLLNQLTFDQQEILARFYSRIAAAQNSASQHSATMRPLPVHYLLSSPHCLRLVQD
jgi:hypothetical protein